ncbi:MAG: hypothetical protein EXX96DRAFT_566150 [Benjaminiella poitrasii]|nr:MAG: hypothetical protein EXX96DRAFT_566150 [Benjaminiella poitrasii]
MNRLPYETFFQIICYLENRDLYQASYVCRYWNRVIRRSKLYEALDISHFRSQHNKMVEFFTDYKEYANTVKKLNVDCSEEIHLEHIRKWPLLFPNVRELNLDFETSESDFDDEDSPDLFFQDNYGPIGFLLSLFESHSFFPTRTEKSFSRWKNLQSVTERNRYMYTVSMLKSNVFKNLNYLMLNFELVYFLSSSRASTELINALSNAPALKHLCLAHAYINLQLLEKLHTNTPLLEILDLKYATLDDNSAWELTTSVEPALTINRLCLEEVTMRSSFKWKILDYISKKYLNMEHTMFKFWLDENLFMEIPVDPLIEERIIHIAKNCRNIREFDVDIHPFTKNILDAFDEINLMRIKDFFSLSRNMEELINLSHSNQRNYIEHLNVTVSDIEIDFQSIIHRFTNLTTINLSFCPHHMGPGQGQTLLPLPLNTFMNHHPNLMNLKIHSFLITLDDITQPIRTFEIDKLELYSIAIPDLAEENLSRLLDYICQSCPNLKLLALSIKSLKTIINPEDIVMDLSRHNISTLNIFIKGFPYVHLRDIQGNSVWYSIRKQHSVGSAAYIRLKVEPRRRRATRSNPDTGTIFIKCRNVEDIVLPTGNGFGFIYHL